MSHNTGNAAVDDILNTYLNKAFVSDLMFDLQHQKFTMKGDIPKGGGNVLRFNEFTPPTKTGYTTTGTTALVEGSVSGNEIAHITITPTNLTLAEFGEFVKVTSLYDLASQPGTRERMRKRMSDGAAVTLDTYTHGKARATTAAIYAISGVAGASSSIGAAGPTALGATAIMFGRKVLKEALAQPFSGIAGHPDGTYAAVLSEKQEFDIVSEITTGRAYWNNGVVNVPGQLGQEKWVKGYMGTIYGTACYSTNNFTTAVITGTTCDVGLMYADGGIGAASIAQMQPEIIINDVNSPYKNLDSIAWHTYYEAALLASARVVKIYSVS